MSLLLCAPFGEFYGKAVKLPPRPILNIDRSNEFRPMNQIWMTSRHPEYSPNLGDMPMVRRIWRAKRSGGDGQTFLENAQKPLSGSRTVTSQTKFVRLVWRGALPRRSPQPVTNVTGLILSR